MPPSIASFSSYTLFLHLLPSDDWGEAPTLATLLEWMPSSRTYVLVWRRRPEPRYAHEGLVSTIDTIDYVPGIGNGLHMWNTSCC